MSSDIVLLLWAAGAIAVMHTLVGPDHYVPFVAMSRALGWSRTKTIWITVLCGLGHVLSSVVLGTVGITLGLVVTQLESWESYRSEIAVWFLIAFGLTYFVWGLRYAVCHHPHEHVHVHAEGVVHTHLRVHEHDHVHVHAAASLGEESSLKRVTPWVLFTIFVFGPCEPLIPLLMYPAAQKSISGLVLVTLVFGLTTLATMTLVVLACSLGLARLATSTLERHAHALAGAAVLFCGLAMKLLSF